MSSLEEFVDFTYFRLGEPMHSKVSHVSFQKCSLQWGEVKSVPIINFENLY
jgi:hypothetical protein